MLCINRVYLKIFKVSCNVQAGLDSGEPSESREGISYVLVNAMNSLGGLREETSIPLIGNGTESHLLYLEIEKLNSFP